MESITSVRIIHSYQLEAHMGAWYKAMLHDAVAAGRKESLVSGRANAYLALPGAQLWGPCLAAAFHFSFMDILVH